MVLGEVRKASAPSGYIPGPSDGPGSITQAGDGIPADEHCYEGPPELRDGAGACRSWEHGYSRFLVPSLLAEG
ncbi:hypothetical protein K438DRAFT_1814402 [Mycena galopus ATCC 62051]|nr:hypothetical protein K438DRAFT_1814402 [Mycena galopus ATCC 62051]